MQQTLPPEILAVHSGYLDSLRQAVALGKPEVDEKKSSLNLYTQRDEEYRPYDLVKTVAVLPLRGFLFKRGWWWGCSYDYFADLIRLAVADYAVDTILLDVETPGGGIYGCPDCSDVIFEARKYKKVIAVVNDLCASAGLWLTSAASEIVITQSGEIGSIGVYEMRFDYTKMLADDGIRVDVIRAGAQKAWGSPYLPTTDEELAVRQADVDASYDMFISAVARNRGVSTDLVRKDWADARMFDAKTAVSIGLADRIASFDKVLAELVGRDVITGDNSNGNSDSNSSGQPTAKRRWSGICRR
ncbi:MAG: S49 family peptidase [Planctomycetota bacterium]